MKIPLYQVDAFAEALFSGNPAAVCPLESWPEDQLLQAIAAENNLSETAFFVPEGDGYRIRWFTPASEVDLCGHATLAAAAVIGRELVPGLTPVCFDSCSGPLAVAVDDELLTLDFPARSSERIDPPTALLEGLGVEPGEVRVSDNYMAVLQDQADVEAVRPRYETLAGLDRIGVIVTAPGREVDFVSRFFAPAIGIPEDPVTGFAHCMLTPYWSRRLGKSVLRARQISARGGELLCEDRGDRVSIAGRAITYLRGTIEVPG